MAPTSEVLTLERDGHVATLWLDSPERRNAMGPDLWSDLPVMMAEVSDDDDVRALVIAARGPAFTVGLDLKTMGSAIAGEGGAGGTSEAARRKAALRGIKRLQASINAVADCPKPVIAAVHGWCIGGGIDLICACDVRLASADTTFSVRETKIAIVADLGTPQRLPGIVTKGHVAELAYTGKDISAERAAEIGLVNQVLPDADACHKAAHEMAFEIASNSPLAVQGTKAVLRASEGKSVEEGLDYVGVWNAAFLTSDDLTEAFTAFLEKRPPEFTGQ
ncbi:MAG: crotonase/enoyl-CoA hydratase family protein [Acidimicrobiia bacterium]|nr:crotonase/enoyl-CoA hydratase family protein [Acidimicrobiia bacterium]